MIVAVAVLVSVLDAVAVFVKVFVAVDVLEIVPVEVAVFVEVTVAVEEEVFVAVFVKVTLRDNVFDPENSVCVPVTVNVFDLVREVGVKESL